MANASPRILPDTAPEMFYILGTTQDTDGGDLTDVYERLVTHTQTNNPADDGTRPLVGIDLANTVVREQGGTTTQLNVWRAGSTAQPLAVALQRTGTATPGLDFTLAPIGNDGYPMDSVVTIPQGAANLLVTLTALTDSPADLLKRFHETSHFLFGGGGIRNDTSQEPVCEPGITNSICELRPLSFTKLAISLDLRCLKHAPTGRAESVLEGHASACEGA